MSGLDLSTLRAAAGCCSHEHAPLADPRRLLLAVAPRQPPR